MTKEEVGKLLAPLTMFWKGGLDEAQIAWYHQAFEKIQGFEAIIMKEAIDKVIDTYGKETFPKPAIIMEAYREVSKLPKHFDVKLANGVIIPKNQAILYEGVWMRQYEYYDLMDAKKLEAKNV